MAIKHCLTSDSAWLNGAIRRRWSPAELLALERWAGVLPVQMICRRLDRSERSVRCQMHRRGLSTRVREGVGLRQVCEDLQLSARSVKASSSMAACACTAHKCMAGWWRSLIGPCAAGCRRRKAACAVSAI